MPKITLNDKLDKQHQILVKHSPFICILTVIKLEEMLLNLEKKKIFLKHPEYKILGNITTNLYLIRLIRSRLYKSLLFKNISPTQFYNTCLLLPSFITHNLENYGAKVILSSARLTVHYTNFFCEKRKPFLVLKTRLLEAEIQESEVESRKIISDFYSIFNKEAFTVYYSNRKRAISEITKVSKIPYHLPYHEILEFLKN